MKKNKYEEIVLNATAYIKANSNRRMPVPELALHTGFSIRHMRDAFRKVLNQSLVEYILSIKLGRAKELLAKTKLEITQIAFESGFETYAYFANAFRKNTGITPSQYREAVVHLGEAIPQEPEMADMDKKDVWFRDSFAGRQLSSAWRPLAGQWAQEDGCLCGAGGTPHIALDRPLPENCRISFQTIAVPNPNAGNPSVSLSIMDAAFSMPYCGLTLAVGKRDAGELVHCQDGRYWNSKARTKDGLWNDVILEIKEDILQLSINREVVFLFREPFPFAFPQRSHLTLSAYKCDIRFRTVGIQNLGFRPVIHPIRQGDALYNSGLPDKAMEFYLRYLRAGDVSDSMTMELRYKIGMCCLQQNAFSNAKNWMDKVVKLRDEPFWSRQAQLALLEICRQTIDLDGLIPQLAICLADEETRGGARIAAQLCATDFDSRGFFAESVALLNTWVRHEEGSSFACQTAKILLAEDLLRIRRFRDAEAALKDVAGPADSTEMALYARINLMQLYHERGDFAASEDMRIEVQNSTCDSFNLVRCTLQRAANFRAQGRFEDAIIVLKSIGPEYPNVEGNIHLHAWTQIACLHCCRGCPEEGKKALEQTHILFPDFHPNSRHTLPFHLVETNYAAAAESLLIDYRNARDLVSSSAELGVKAGILHELAGKSEEAKSIFKEVNQRFPEEHVRYFGQLASALLSRDGFDFTQMPYEHHRRSEMFYLLGLLMEKRGDKEAARALFELGVKEDPALRWPAFFSKLKLKR